MARELGAIPDKSWGLKGSNLPFSFFFYLRVCEVLGNVGQHEIIRQVELGKISKLGVVEHVIVPS